MTFRSLATRGRQPPGKREVWLEQCRFAPPSCRQVYIRNMGQTVSSGGNINLYLPAGFTLTGTTPSLRSTAATGGIMVGR